MFASACVNNRVVTHGLNTISVNDQNTNNKQSILVNKIQLVNNTHGSLKGVSNSLHHEVKKTVTFDLRQVTFLISGSNSDDRKNDFSLPLLEREYRREVDKEARKHGLTFAAGHENYSLNSASSPYPYDHDVAMAEYNKLG